MAWCGNTTFADCGRSSLARVVDDLDAAGKNGWELVSAHWHDEATVTMTLKRPRFPVIDAKED